MSDGRGGAGDDARGRTPPDFARRERLETLGATLASVAHELNNPLTAIVGFAQLLLEREHTAADRAALETIRREAERSSRIVRELLALARGEEGEAIEPVDLNDVVMHVVRTRRYAQTTRGIDCATTLATARPLVLGGRRQMEQVVLNLLTNAERATASQVDAARDVAVGADHPRIAITTQLDGDEVHVMVDDCGPGLSPDAVANAWDPFWTTGREDGTGLGLHLVRRIVDAHGGRVTAEEGPLGGARFHVVLPAVRGHEAMIRGHRPLDVLVVHDDLAHMDFLTRFLSSRGHAVVCSRPDRVGPVLARMPFDVVVCELASLGEASVADHVNGVGERSRLIVTAPHPPQGMPLPAGAIYVREPFDVELLRHAVEDRH